MLNAANARSWMTRLRSLRDKPVRLDVLLALLIFIVGMIVGMVDVSQWSDRGRYYQDRFAPAVMFACGHGYTLPQKPIPELTAFLSIQTRSYTDTSVPDTFDCSLLPENVPTRPLLAFHNQYRYLLTAAALVWSIRGVSWMALSPLFGILYGLTLAASYGLFRLGMNRRVALVLTFVWMFSWNHLTMLPHLRDYGKAPWIIATLLIIGYMIKKPRPTRVLLTMAALAGLVVGIGVGFRTDLLLMIPVFLLMALMLPGKLTQTALVRVGAVVIFLGIFYVVSRPILGQLGQGSNTAHNAIDGFMSTYDEPLGITPSVYEVGYLHRDRLIQWIFSSFAYCFEGRTEPLELATLDYDRLGYQYLQRILVQFPADMVARAYSSVLRIINLPFDARLDNPNAPQAEMPHIITNPAMLGFYQFFRSIQNGYTTFADRFLPNLGLLFWFVSVLIISRRSWRLALFLFLVPLYLGGTLILQFMDRHYFHLEVLALWFTGFVVYRAITYIWQRRQTPPTTENRTPLPRTWAQVSPANRQMLAFAIGMPLLLILPLTALRWYQQRHAAGWLQDYLALGVTAVQTADSPASGANRTLIRTLQFPSVVPQQANPDEPAVHAEYLVVDIDAQAVVIPITFRYARQGSSWSGTLPSAFDMSRTIYLPARPQGADQATATTRYYYPVFAGPQTEFAGLEVPDRYRAAVRGIYRVKENCAFPTLLWLKLEPGWESATYYQRLADWEGASDNSLVEEAAADDPATRERQAKAKEYVQQAAAKARAKDYAGAIADFSAAIELDPDNPAYYLNRATWYRADRKYAEAVADFDQALKLRPNYHLAYYGRGLTRLLQQDYQQALTDLNRALEIEADYTPAYSTRGQVYMKLQDYDKAVADYDRVVEADESLSSGYFARGLAYVARKKDGDREKAIADFKVVLEISPSEDQKNRAQTELDKLEATP